MSDGVQVIQVAAWPVSRVTSHLLPRIRIRSMTCVPLVLGINKQCRTLIVRQEERV
jgi:hypothetical protein